MSKSSISIPTSELPTGGKFYDFDHVVVESNNATMIKSSSIIFTIKTNTVGDFDTVYNCGSWTSKQMFKVKEIVQSKYFLYSVDKNIFVRDQKDIDYNDILKFRFHDKMDNLVSLWISPTGKISYGILTCSPPTVCKLIDSGVVSRAFVFVKKDRSVPVVIVDKQEYNPKDHLITQHYNIMNEHLEEFAAELCRTFKLHGREEIKVQVKK